MKQFSLQLLFIIIFFNPLRGSDSNSSRVFLPFALYSENTGYFGGIGMMQNGWLQPESKSVIALFRGKPMDTDQGKSALSGGFVMLKNLHLLPNRLFHTSLLGYRYTMPRQAFYFDSSHDSDNQTVWNSESQVNYVALKTYYTIRAAEKPFLENAKMKIGAEVFYYGTTLTDATEAMPGGMDAPKSWNSSGVTFFWSCLDIDSEVNPAKGYKLLLQYSIDPGYGDALQSWDTIDLSLSRYYALPNIPGVTASVLAWNFWTAYSPSWNKATAPNGIERNRPPMWLGPKLGGSTRMRGFNTNRFADKSALYTALEYRTVLHFNPLKQGYFGAWMKRQFPVEWFQTALFVEAGRVHSHYNPKLLEDMKYDVGFSVRTYIESILIRGAIAHSREGTQLTVSIDQPF